MKNYFLLCTIFLFFTDCNDNKKNVQISLTQAQELYEQAQYSSAKQILDELKVQYPKELEAQKKALLLMRKIEWKEQERNLAFCDSMIAVRQAEADSMKHFFIFEKTEYDDDGKYIEKSWNPPAETQLNYIKTLVTESGEIALISVYNGFSDLQYDRLKVSTASGEYMETQVIPFDGGANYSFQDGNGRRYQIVTYQKGRDNGVIGFIYNHSSEKLTVAYLGKKKYSYIITSPMKKALVNSVNLAVALSDVRRLQKEKEKAEKRIEYLQSKI
ncbi:MAG: hypothetical protein LBG15_10375 [Dysgonamonadaceae bacterium]|jgi:hypothetical protein|nr:hypothetical protein [Dysgonamonadaceae bacterium]